MRLKLKMNITIFYIAQIEESIYTCTFVHGYLLQSLEEATYFGLTIRKDLKWKSQENKVCTKANKMPGILLRKP